MGVDANIFYRVRDGMESDTHLRCAESRLIEKPDEWEDMWFPRLATHSVDLDGNNRYYSDGYERGDWPTIAGVLMALLADPAIETVWYGGDTSGQPPEATPARVLELCAHWMKHGNRPYYDRH
jgi:hypothetical protein